MEIIGSHVWFRVLCIIGTVVFVQTEDLPDSSPEGAIEIPEDPEDICSTVMCGPGRECVLLDTGEPTCVCQSECPDEENPVCGSTGITYDNHCQLHRAACIQGIKIHHLHNGACTPEEIPQKTQPEADDNEKPLVCYLIERDQLRKLLIDWFSSQVEEDGFFFRGKSYGEVLDEKFSECDTNQDSQLDAEEFVYCVEKNETVTDMHSGQTGHILRGLCVDALIVMADSNSDWLLDPEEFKRCMDAAFVPPSKKCSLEEKTYEDGAETRVKCNICVCACGNWVCTAAACHSSDHTDLDMDNITYSVQQGELPSKEERQQLLQGFKASEHISLDQIEREVPADLLVESKADDNLNNEGENDGPSES